MLSIRSLLRVRAAALLWLVPVLGLGIVGQQVLSARRQEAAIRMTAEALLAGIDADAQVSAEEYDVWKELAGANSDIRIAAGKLLQEPRYSLVLLRSEELIGRTVVGADRDGAVSRQRRPVAWPAMRGSKREMKP